MNLSIDAILLLANKYESFCNDYIKYAIIKKMPNGKYRVLSKKNKNLGTFDTKEEANKRLQQVEYFKHKKASKDFIDLTGLEEFSYSALMRLLNKKASKDQILDFLTLFKSYFDKAFCKNVNKEEIHDYALSKAFIQFSKMYELKIDEEAFEKIFKEVKND